MILALKRYFIISGEGLFNQAQRAIKNLDKGAWHGGWVLGGLLIALKIPKSRAKALLTFWNFFNVEEKLKRGVV